MDAQEKAFLDQLQADPHDRATRLVYADWLEERADPRGEYLRLGLQLLDQPADPSRLARFRELGAAAPPEWLIRVDDPAIEGCCFPGPCPCHWSGLDAPDAQPVRCCSSCGLSVAYCPTVREAQAQANQGQCVALSSHLKRTAGDLFFQNRCLRLQVLRGQRPNVGYPIYQGLNFIGRADQQPVDIDLEEQEPPDRVWSSRQHAVIRCDEEFSIEDLNSANGTYLNRRRVYPGQRAALKIGDVIQIGTVQLRVLF